MRDASRRILDLSFDPICRKNCVAGDRTCTRVTPRNLHGKEGSTVRVRKRASLKCLQNGRAPCLGSKRPSRAGTRGLSLMFPCWAHRHAEFGLFNEIWPRPTPTAGRRPRLFPACCADDDLIIVSHVRSGCLQRARAQRPTKGAIRCRDT